MLAKNKKGRPIPAGKLCGSCGKFLASDSFGACAGKWHGLSSWCKGCISKWNAARWAAGAEERLEKKLHREFLAYTKRNAASYSRRLMAPFEIDGVMHRICASCGEIRPGEKAKCDSCRTEYYRSWAAANRERVRELKAKHRAVRRGCSFAHDRPRIKAIYAAQDGRCAYCRRLVGGDYHVDHILPICAGGTHEAGNLQVLCPPCNLSKGRKLPEEYAKEIGLLL